MPNIQRITHLYMCTYLIFSSFVAHHNAADVPNRVHIQPEIRNLTELLEKSLNKKVLNYTISPLTDVNDHFGGTLHNVDVQLAFDDVRIKNSSNQFCE